MTDLTIDLTPEEYASTDAVRRALAQGLGVKEDTLPPYRIVRRSIDCRRRNILYHCQVEVGAEPAALPTPMLQHPPFRSQIVIVGAGPAGLFAALRALQLGVKPIIVERGKPVEQRKADIVDMVRSKTVDPDSNWCFGEGGAGTYSDGKLYTRSTKRGNVQEVLRQLVAHGADPDILVDVHAHIGTDRLPAIIARIRETITQSGGEYHFGSRVVDLIVRDGRVCGVVTEGGDRIEGAAVILATGHSARDIYALFARRGWLLEAKPFALGVRVEHPQALINEIQYHGPRYSSLLPPATYSLTTQVGGHGVFSFCMCPGGVIVPAATAPGQQVVNGMSNAARNSGFANSCIAVTVGLNEELGLSDEEMASPLALLEFQKGVEQRAYAAAGGTIDAPAQRLVDFLDSRNSSSLPRTNYMGSVVSAPLHQILPSFVVGALQQAFRHFDRSMHGFITRDATLLAVESRTSSPVRIPRDRESLQHPQLRGLYPCGEGAGYAGGIVSSALDGIRCAECAAGI